MDYYVVMKYIENGTTRYCIIDNYEDCDYAYQVCEQLNDGDDNKYIVVENYNK